MSDVHSTTTANSPGRYVRGTIDAATVLAVLGLVLLVFSLTGTLNNYVKPFFRPIMAVTALAFLALAGWSVAAAERGQAGTAGHAHNPLRPTSWLLLVPVLLAAVCVPEPLGSQMVESQSVASMAANQQRAVQRVGRNADGTIAYPELTEPVNEITLEDLSNRYTFGSKEQLLGKKVKVLGFAVSDDAGWMIARFKIYCCAADALPFRAQLATAGAAGAEPSADAWYEVVGTVTEDGGDLPGIAVEELNPIEQPKTPYL